MEAQRLEARSIMTPLGSAFDPWVEAERLQLCVEERRLRSGHLGEYHHARALILLAPGMTFRQARSTLTHELMHARAGDRPTHLGFLHAKQERRARIATAELLVDPQEYASAEQLVGPHADMIARYLDVDAQVVSDWIALEHQTPPGPAIARDLSAVELRLKAFEALE